MVSLREEFGKHKLEKQKAINEAAISWVLENVILLNETFNREALQRLQGSISKFDSTFKPFASRVPELKQSLDDAIEIMNKITMGEKIVKKGGKIRLTDEEKDSIKEPATYMVKYLSLLYNNLSRFFNKDMKALIDFPVFRKAKENPHTPLKDLVESDRMKKAILHALVPSSDASAIMKRMYKTMELPTLNYGKIADELLNLSLDDFLKLTKVDKVPLVVTPDETKTESQGVQNAEDDVLTEEEQAVLKEIGEIDTAQLTNIVKSLQKIQGVVRAVPELQNLGQALDSLRAQAQANIAKGGVLSGVKGRTIAATANMVYTYFEKIGKLWPQLKTLFDTAEGRQMSEQEIANVQAILTKAQGGLMAKIGNWWKTRALPGLAPSQIAEEIMNVVRAGQENPEEAIAAMDSLSTLFERLNALKLAPATTPQGQPVNPANASPGQTPGTAGTTGPAAAAPGSQTTNPAAAKAPQATGQSAAATDPEQLAGLMGQTIGTGSNPQFVEQVKKLVDAGWQLTPPRV
jgi:hypothetical protein